MPASVWLLIESKRKPLCPSWCLSSVPAEVAYVHNRVNEASGGHHISSFSKWKHQLTNWCQKYGELTQVFITTFSQYCWALQNVKRTNIGDKISACAWDTNSSSQLLLGHGTSSSKEYNSDDTGSYQHEGVSVRYYWWKNKKIKYEWNSWSNHCNTGTVKN